MKKLYVFLIIFFVPLWVYPSSSEGDSKQKKRTFFLTVPKSGTHLLKKMLYMVMGENTLYFTNITQDPYKPPSIPNAQRFIFNHVAPGFSQYKESNRDKYIKVILIRDPRDAIVSMMMHMLDWFEWTPLTPIEAIEKFCNLPEEERLAQTILFPDEYLGLRVFLREAIEWMKDPNVFVLHFEDIIGPQGGGDRITQEKTIRELCEHLELDISQEKITFIADNLFGGTKSFRAGQIGTWPQYFTESDKELFKLVLGEELIQMGYETDNDW